jgi:hypothetical protein
MKALERRKCVAAIWGWRTSKKLFNKKRASFRNSSAWKRLPWTRAPNERMEYIGNNLKGSSEESEHLSSVHKNTFNEWIVCVCEMDWIVWNQFYQRMIEGQWMEEEFEGKGRDSPCTSEDNRTLCT